MMVSRILPQLATLLLPLTYLLPTGIVIAIAATAGPENSPQMNATLIVLALLAVWMIGQILAATVFLGRLVAATVSGSFSSQGIDYGRSLTKTLWLTLIPQIAMVIPCGIVGQVDDAPGMILLALIPPCYTSALALLSGVFTRLLINGTQLQEEAMLTI